jgi:urea carboxylase
MSATLDGKAVPYWAPVDVPAGSVLTLGAIQGAGQRTYLAVKGGFVVPLYLGSKATFTLGQFGGHVGRALRTGDVLGYRAGSHAPLCSPTKRRMNAPRRRRSFQHTASTGTSP